MSPGMKKIQGHTINGVWNESKCLIIVKLPTLHDIAAHRGAAWMSSQIKIMETNKQLCDMKGYNICESKHPSKTLKISSKSKNHMENNWNSTGTYYYNGSWYIMTA